MKVTNKTAWRTDQLRHFVREIAKIELEPGNRKRTTVTFEHCGGSPCRKVPTHGHVFLNLDRRGRKDQHGGDVTIYLPRPWDEPEWFHQSVAMVLAHEFAHIATGQWGRAWELRRRGSPRYGYGYGKNAGRFKEWYRFALSWPLDPA